jgi:hypothetical protein
MAASAPKPIKKLGGAIPTASDLVAWQYDPPAPPLDQGAVAQALLQLQNTVNELITRHNQLCTDTAHAGDAVTGAGTTATNLFTAT